MPEKSAQVVAAVQRGTSFDDVQPELFDINSWQGRRRKLAEIKRRLQGAEPPVWADLPELATGKRSVVMYYCCLKTYRLLFDFHMDVVLPKWQSMDRKLGPHDARRFLERRADAHPEIDGWSDGTRQKIRQVVLQMLREAGFLSDGELQRPRLSDSFWERFVKVGDVWFLEAAFLNKPTRTSVVESALA